jgi:hypothetical protein
MRRPYPSKKDFAHSEKERLSAYKRDELGVAENGRWKRNNKPYPHILPYEKRELNILPAFRREFWIWFRETRIQLHTDFHHLNSSQAVCFNLFFPLWRETNCLGLQALLNCLDVTGVPDAGAAFEFEPNSVEGTHFDFMLPLQSTLKGRTRRIYFEIKYTESGFHGPKPDARHLDKFNQIYQPRLADRFDQDYCSYQTFLKHYQILRNVWHLDREAADVVIFLMPKANMRLRQAEPVIRSCALEPFRSRIKIVYFEDLLPMLAAELNKNQVDEAGWVLQFRRKYFPPQEQISELL